MRYLPLTADDRAAMLARIGVSSIDDLFCDVPEAARLSGPIEGLAGHRSELAVERLLGAMAARNMAAGAHPFFLGAGAYRHHVPATVDHLIQRGEFLTSYTPYQPEIAQGTLQYLFEFQTQVARLFEMDIANASMYDGSTALTEAIFMARRLTRRATTLVSGGLHPHYVAAARTLGRFSGDRLRIFEPRLRDAAPGDDLADLIAAIDSDTSAVVVQYPNLFGHVADLSPLAEAAHRHGALLIVVVTEVVALGAITAPGAMGADIVVGEGQSLGNDLNFGGPYLGLFACRKAHVRQMPGRLCGETVDADGRRGYVLTLSTREQHIRREKATSNICTNAGLCSLAFSIHLALLGGRGLQQLAQLNHSRAVITADRLAAIPGIHVLNGPFFNEFTVDLGMPARDAIHQMAERGVLAGVSVARLCPDRPDLDSLMLVAATETVSDDDIEALVRVIKEVRQ